jgi:hypothetical protein
MIYVNTEQGGMEADRKRVECPVCGCCFPISVINEHIDKCLISSETAKRSTTLDGENDHQLIDEKRPKLDSSSCDSERRGNADTPTRSSCVRSSFDNVSDEQQSSFSDDQKKTVTPKDSWKSFLKKCGDQSRSLANAAACSRW